MIPIPSRRLLINSAVVAIAVGANALLAYTQICAQRDVSARVLRSADVREALDGYGTGLDDSLAQVGRFVMSGEAVPADAVDAHRAQREPLEAVLRTSFTGDPLGRAALDRLDAANARFEHDLAQTLMQAGVLTSNPADKDAGEAPAQPMAAERDEPGKPGSSVTGTVAPQSVAIPESLDKRPATTSAGAIGLGAPALGAATRAAPLGQAASASSGGIGIGPVALGATAQAASVPSKAPHTAPQPQPAKAALDTPDTLDAPDAPGAIPLGAVANGAATSGTNPAANTMPLAAPTPGAIALGPVANGASAIPVGTHPANATPLVSTGDSPYATPAPADARTALTQAYPRLVLERDAAASALAALRKLDADTLEQTITAANQQSHRALPMLLVTMLAGAALLILTFGLREKDARRKLHLASTLSRKDERFRGLFDEHPVPMYIVERDSLRFLAVNAAAIEQYGYSEAEFLAMTVRDIRPTAEVARLESHLHRLGDEPGTGRIMAGVWHHQRKNGSTITADISYHALTFMGRQALFVLADDVSEQINAEAEAQRSNQMLETVMDNIPQRIFWKDRESRYLGCNMAFARDAGLAYPEQVVGKTDDDLPWRDAGEHLRELDAEVMDSGVPKVNFEVDLVIGGELRTTMTSKLPFTDSDGRVLGILGSYADITARKRTDLALRLQSRALEASVNAILITAPTGGGNLIEYVNPAFKRITGYEPSEVIGHDCRLLQRDDRDQEGVSAIRQALSTNREVSAVVRNYRKDGALFWNQLFIAPVPDAKGVITHHIGIIHDITELMRYQEQLEYQANYDSLTRLPNRNLLRDRLQTALIGAKRRANGVAVVFIDLDGFKNVNDSLGHSTGDRLLSVVGDRLARCVRATDTVARHGGDEFVVVMTDTTDEQSLIAWMERVRAAISEPVWLDNTELYVGCSMGASLFPQDGEDAETLMKKADLAMYRAKDMGRNTFQFFQPEMNANVGARLNLERRLRRALRDNEFLLHYQPQVDILTGAIVGTEALVRWMDPEIGLVSPASFIPVAEESGLIGPLSEWVLREACRQNKAWQDAGLPPARVSVNFSARVFQQRDISKLVRQVLAETGLAPQWLELELTESAIMRNAEEAVSMLTELSGLGIGLAIDDFGTGYSSLSYLKRFPVDRLKIDRSFVSDIGSSSDDETITSAIIALAHSLQLQVIAEGVETYAQLDFLRQRNCDEMQGYFFSKPMPEEAISAMFRINNRDRARLAEPALMA